MGKVITFFSCIAALFVLCVPAYSEPTPEQIKERTNLLLQAIENNNVEQAKVCIQLGADVNAKNKDGSTAFMIAAEKNAAGIAKVLIEAGADVSVTDDNGKTLFVKMISDCKYYIASLLAKAGADVEAKNSSGDTLLMQSVKNGNKQDVKILINMGADTNTTDSEGITALTYAALYGRNDIAELLKAGKTDIVTDMVYVKGGTFQMGDSEQEPTVTVSSFYMSKYEVTQAEYWAVMGTNPSEFKGGQRPVENVSWYDAVNYCNILSEIEGLMPCYTIDGTNVTCDWSANGYRLPTQAEWEYAARGGIHKSTYRYSGSDGIDEVAWYGKNSGNETHEVGKKKANALGIYDMSGNVWEWCWDWFGSNDNSAEKDPLGPASGGRRVVRGGDWGNDADRCRCACRDYGNPSGRSGNRGFRVVRSGK